MLLRSIAGGRIPTLIRTIARFAAPWLVIAAAAGMGVAGLLPPAPVGTAAPAGEFSAERAFAHVAAIARQNRAIGSPGNAAAREYLVAELEAMGITVDLQPLLVPDYYGGSAGSIRINNIIGLIPGFNPAGSVVLMGHYDTPPGVRGANDDAAAVAAILEAGRALLAGSALRNNIILLLTDGEEPAPRYGSTEFVAHSPLAGDVGLVVNFEAVGGSGPSALIETSGDRQALIAEYAAADPHPVAYSYLADLAELLGGSGTDFAPFRDAGIPGFHFAYLHGSPIYHTPDDGPESVHLSSLQHQGSHALALARHFGDLDLDRYRGGGHEVYFSLLGRAVLHYPARWGIVLVSLTGLLLTGVLAAGRRSARWSVPRVAAGAAVLLGLALAAALATDLGWRLVLAVFWQNGGPSVAAAILVAAVLLAAVAAAVYAGYRRLARRVGDLQMEAAGIATWWLFALLASLLLPGTGYLFAWPALAATLATGIGLHRGFAILGWWGRLGVLGLVAVPTVVLVIPALDTFYQLGQPRPGNVDSQVLDMVAFAGLLAALAAGLLIPHLRRALRATASP